MRAALLISDPRSKMFAKVCAKIFFRQVRHVETKIFFGIGVTPMVASESDGSKSSRPSSVKMVGFFGVEDGSGELGASHSLDVFGIQAANGFQRVNANNQIRLP